MPARNAKGQFLKRGHKKSGKRKHHKSKTRVVHVAGKTRVVHVKSKTHRRRHGSGGGGVGLKHLVLGTLGLAFLTGQNAPIAAIPDNLKKLPGTATFGTTAVAGGFALAIDKWLWRNKWLRAAGWAGVILGAAQVGDKGKNFAWVGDAAPGRQLRGEEPVADINISGDEEMGDEEMGDEEMGDEETGALDVDDDDDDDDEETDGPDVEGDED
jgi:hypothetical protein